MARKVEWTQEITRNLIEMYETHACLYDSKHNFYSNKHARNDALLAITAELQKSDAGIQVDDVKKKITNLRQQFSHEKAKVGAHHSGMETEELYQPTVWWYEKLLFLTPYIKTRKTISTLDSTDTSPEDDAVETDLSEENERCNNDNASHPKETPKAISKKRKMHETEQDPIINQAVSTLKTLESSISKQKSNWDVFAEYIANELKDIDDDDLINNVKHEINNMIYEAKKQWAVIKRARLTVQPLQPLDIITIPFNEANM